MNESKKLDELAEEINALRRRIESERFSVLLDGVLIGQALKSAPKMDYRNRDQYIPLFAKYGWTLSAPSNPRLPDVRDVAADLKFISPWFSILLGDEDADE